MPEENSSLEPRVDALEVRMTRIEAEQAGTRALAAGTDRELSEVQVELRVHRSLIQALQQTQSETLSRVRELERKMDDGFAMTAAGFAAIGERLDRLAGES